MISEELGDDSFGTSRLLFYGGLVLMGALVLRPAGGFTLSDWFFLAAAAIAMTRFAVSRDTRIYGVPPLLVAGSFLLILGALASSFRAFDPSASVALAVRFGYITLLWFAVGALVLRRAGHVERAVGLWCIAIAAAGGGAVLQLIAGDVVPGANVAWGRMSGLTQHVNDLGGMSGIAFLPAFVLATEGTRSWKRLLSIGVLVLIICGLVLSGSVGGLVAAGAAVLTWFAIRGVSGPVALLSAAAAVLLFVFLAATDRDVASPFERVSVVTSADGTEQATLWSRIETMRVALRTIRDEPLVGVGLDLESRTTLTGFEVHNILLKPFYEAGLAGGVGMLLVLAAVGSVAMRSIRAASTERERRLAVSLLCAYVGALAFGLSAPVLFNRYAWAPALLILALAAVQERRVASGATAAVPDERGLSGELALRPGR